jgi:predicted DNA-binding protein (UPF0251 family)
MFSNPRVNPTLERILLLDQDIYEQPGQPAFDARQGASRLAVRRRRYLKPNVPENLELEYLAGATLKQVGERFGIHRNTVSQILKRRGVQIRYQSLGRDEIELAKVLYGQGLSLAKVGAHLNCDDATVWRALKGEGVAMRDAQGREVV